VKPTFDNALRRIAATVGMKTRDEPLCVSDGVSEWRSDGVESLAASGLLVLCPLKSLDRASEKVQHKYRNIDPGPPESWLYDVVRASFICHSDAQIAAVCDSLQAFPSFEVVRIKNRFTAPLVNGYRDIQLIVRLIVKNQLGHLVSFICEVCVTHASLAQYELDYPSARVESEYFTPLLTGSVEKQETLCHMLEEFVSAVENEKAKHTLTHSHTHSLTDKDKEVDAEVDLVALVCSLGAPHYEQGQAEAEAYSTTRYFDEDLDFVLENWVELLSFLHMYEQAEQYQKVVLKIVMQIGGGEEDHPDVAEALDTHAMLLKLQVRM
jgi:ppGpp synthetase/RelA/SpoT-type nucleotidyltranferase